MPHNRVQYYPARVHNPYGDHCCDFPYNMMGYSRPEPKSTYDRDQRKWVTNIVGTLRELNDGYVKSTTIFFALFHGITIVEEMTGQISLDRSWIACDGSRCAEFTVNDTVPAVRIQVRQCENLNVRGKEHFLFFYFPEWDTRNDPTTCALEIGDTRVGYDFDYDSEVRPRPARQYDDLLTPPQRELRDLLAEVCLAKLPELVS